MTLFISSCSSDDDSYLQNVKPVQRISGTLTLANSPDTVEIGGKKIVLNIGSKKCTSNIKAAPSKLNTRGQIIIEEYGPFYTKGTPRELTGGEYQNRKVIVNGQFGVPTGVYFADVWKTAGIVKLPANTYTARVDLPNPCGFDDIGNMTIGINWNMASSSAGVELEWNFYTLVLNYNAVGQQMWHVIPLDGADVVVPYYYSAIVNQ